MSVIRAAKLDILLEGACGRMRPICVVYGVGKQDEDGDGHECLGRV